MPLIVLLLAVPAAWAKRTVCTATLNSTQEREIFRAKLPADKFDFVELTDYAKPNESTEEWFGSACAARVQCDVLMVSAHFAGDFFGDSRKFDLKLDPLENHSCKNTCDGVIKRPKEIFLFGCNTLATKEKGNRTPEQYLKALLEHGIEQSRAEQIVQARYGLMGDSFRDRMRRVFTGVPRIYGFDDSAPSGATITPFLNTYFERTGDYSKHLDRIEAKSTVAIIERANATLRSVNGAGSTAAFRTTAFSRCDGLNRDDPDYPLRAVLCPLYDTSMAPAARLKYAQSIMSRPDVLKLAPSVMAVVATIQKEYGTTAEVQDALKTFGADPNVRDVVATYERESIGSPSMVADLDVFKFNIGLISKEQLLAKSRASIRPLLKSITEANGQMICDIGQKVSAATAGEVIKVDAEDVNLKKVETALGTAIFICIGTDDQRITAAATRGLNKPAKADERDSQAIGFLRLPGAEDEKLKLALRGQTSKTEVMRELMGQYVFAHTKGSTREDAFARLIGQGKQTGELAKVIKDQKIEDERLARLALEAGLKAPVNERFALGIVGRVAPAQSPIWAESLNRSEGQDYEWIMEYANLRKIRDPKVTDWVLHQLKKEKEPNIVLLQHLATAPLNGEQTREALATIRAQPSSEEAKILRYTLRRQNSSDGKLNFLRGPSKGAECNLATDATGVVVGSSCSIVETKH